MMWDTSSIILDQNCKSNRIYLCLHTGGSGSIIARATALLGGGRPALDAEPLQFRLAAGQTGL